MDVGLIVFLGLIMWLIVAFIMCGATAEDDYETSYTMIFFWPVVLPILMVFGFFYAIWSALRAGIGWFRHG